MSWVFPCFLSTTFIENSKSCQAGTPNSTSHSQKLERSFVEILSATPGWSLLFLIKLQVFSPATLLKENLTQQHRYFPVNIAKYLTTGSFIKHLWWLLLNFSTESQKETISRSVIKTFKYFFQALRRWEGKGGGRGGGGGESSALPKFSANVLFFPKSFLNVSLLKEVIKNVHENQYSTRVSMPWNGSTINRL